MCSGKCSRRGRRIVWHVCATGAVPPSSRLVVQIVHWPATQCRMDEEEVGKMRDSIDGVDVHRRACSMPRRVHRRRGLRHFAYGGWGGAKLASGGALHVALHGAWWGKARDALIASSLTLNDGVVAVKARATMAAVVGAAKARATMVAGVGAGRRRLGRRRARRRWWRRFGRD